MTFRFWMFLNFKLRLLWGLVHHQDKPVPAQAVPLFTMLLLIKLATGHQELTTFTLLTQGVYPAITPLWNIFLKGLIRPG